MPIRIHRSSATTVSFSTPQEIIISHLDDSIRIGDGADLANVTAAGELNVIATAQPGVDIGDVTINNASIPVTQGTNPWTVALQPQTDTGTITAVSQTVSQVFSQTCNTAGLLITGTWTGTIVFEVSVDGATWSATEAIPLSTAGTVVGSTTANGSWTLPCAGTKAVRVRSSAWTSGTANITLVCELGAHISQVYNLNASNLLATVNQGGTWNIDNISGTISLPTGAATSANQSTEITSLQLIDDVPTAMNGAFSKGAPAMGQLDDTATTAATEDNCAPIRITAQRAAHINLRNVSGTEIGTASNPVRTDPTGTTTQPVSGTVAVTQSTSPWVTADNQTITDNAAFTDGTSKLTMGGYILDETAGTALTENDAAAARVDSKRAQVMVIEDTTTRGNRAVVTTPSADNVAVSAFSGLVTHGTVWGFDGTNYDRIRGDSANGLDVDVTNVIPGTAATALGKAEDAVHASGDTGVMALGVRNDFTSGAFSTTAISGNTGDYTPPSVEATGRVHTKIVYEDAGTALTALNTTYNNTTTTANMDFTTAGYTHCTFMCDLVSANVGTHEITFQLRAKDGSNYYIVRNGFLGKFMYDDTATATSQAICVYMTLPATGTCNMLVTATNTTASNTFTITNAKVYLRTV